MFTNHNQLKRKTPEQGINRQEYIQHLVDEYYTTTDVEAQEQVTANLANFAYDPINWSYLKAAKSVELFIELLGLPNTKLILHGLAGLSNLSPDTELKEYISDPDHCKAITKLLLESTDNDIAINSLGLIYQLLLNTRASVLKQQLLTPAVLRHLQELRKISHDQRFVNLIRLIQEDFATRIEVLDDKN